MKRDSLSEMSSGIDYLLFTYISSECFALGRRISLEI